MAVSHGHPGAVVLQVQLATLGGQDSVAMSLARALENVTAIPLVVEWGATIEYALQRRAGRLRDTWKAVALMERLGSSRGSQAAIGQSLYQEVHDRAWFLGDLPGAQRLLDSAVRRFPQDSIPPRDRYGEDYVMAAFATNRADLVREAVNGIRRDDPHRLGLIGGSLALPAYESWLATLEGRHEDAIAAAHRADVGTRVKASLARTAKAYDRAGQTDSARVYYERFLSSTSIDMIIWAEGVNLAHARKRLAEMHEARSEWSKAYDLYAALVHQWRNADPELQPMVRAFRARMTALERRRAQ